MDRARSHTHRATPAAGKPSCFVLAAAVLLPCLAAADALANPRTNASPAKPARRLVLECERDLVAAKRLIPSLEHLTPDARRFRKLEFTRTPQGPLFLGLSGGEKEYEGDGSNAEFSNRVQAACDFCGPTDLLQLEAPETTNALAALRQMAEDFVGGKLEDRRDVVAKVNPATHADPGDPPLLILHGDADPLIALKQSELLYQALKAAGVEVTVGVAKGGGHLFVGAEIDRTVDAFFDQHLLK